MEYNETTGPCSSLLLSRSFLAAMPSFPIQAKPILPSFARDPGYAAAQGPTFLGMWVGAVRAVTAGLSSRAGGGDLLAPVLRHWG